MRVFVSAVTPWDDDHGASDQVMKKNDFLGRSHFGGVGFLLLAPRWLNPVAIATLLVLLGIALPTSAEVRPYNVDHYAARIEPDLRMKTLTGRVRIYLTTQSAGLETLEFDRGELNVTGVTVNGREQPFTLSMDHLLVHLPGGVPAGGHLTVSVDYTGAPRFGLEFAPEISQVYTIFSTSQWLICNDIPSAKATFDLELVLPAQLSVVANGRQISRSVLPNGKQVLLWRESRPIPSYTFGFAAGLFTEVQDNRGQLRYLGSGLSQDELRRIFHETAGIRSFLERRSGIRYDGPTYTQALVAETVGQELGDFSLLSSEYGHILLSDPKAVGLLAHEFAHQWWGNRVTCRDWTQFWLNEGFATFMAAAYLESRFGTEAYLEAIARSRDRYAAVKAKGEDHALEYRDWTHPSASDRTIVYHKGTYVLYQLRLELGEQAFWKSLRDYTRAYIDKTVSTRDFQAAVEKSSHRDLTAFFQKWVYGDGSDISLPVVAIQNAR
jgi:aminopeptidase N